jgi:hypothetical protein
MEKVDLYEITALSVCLCLRVFPFQLLNQLTDVQNVLHKRDVTGEYSSAPVYTGKKFQDLPQLGETADNTERYI